MFWKTKKTSSSAKISSKAKGIPEDPALLKKLESKAALEEINRRLGILTEEDKSELESIAPSQHTETSVVINRGVLGTSTTVIPSKSAAEFSVPAKASPSTDEKDRAVKAKKKKEIPPLKRPI